MVLQIINMETKCTAILQKEFFLSSGKEQPTIKPSHFKPLKEKNNLCPMYLNDAVVFLLLTLKIFHTFF